MRKFTKTHNELRWLFPTCETEGEASLMFDVVEGTAEHLFACAGHKNDDTFDKDDMIDSFMKGYSIAAQFLGMQISQLKSMIKSY